MAYRVNLTARAERDLESIFGYINAVHSAAALRWFLRLQKTILSLADAPRLGKVTREDATAREVIYGRKPHHYRIVYEIVEAGQIVNVLTVWHGRRLPPGR